MGKAKDQQLLQGIREGAPQAIQDCYTYYFEGLHRYILHNSGTKEDAEDVFQEVLVIVYQKSQSDSFVLTASLATYIYSIGKRIWLKRLRELKKQPITTQAILTEDLMEETTDDIALQSKEYLYRKHFLLIGTTCRQLLLLFFQGKKNREIAKKLAYTPEYAKKKKAKCIRQLIRSIESDPLFKALKKE